MPTKRVRLLPKESPARENSLKFRFIEIKKSGPNDKGRFYINMTAYLELVTKLQ